MSATIFFSMASPLRTATALVEHPSDEHFECRSVGDDLASIDGLPVAVGTLQP